MHDQLPDKLKKTFDALTDAEKRELLAQIQRTAGLGNGGAPKLSPQQVAERLAQIAALPIESPDDGFSGADHDQVLYRNTSQGASDATT
jgi:hypothetical protein